MMFQSGSQSDDNMSQFSTEITQSQDKSSIGTLMPLSIKSILNGDEQQIGDGSMLMMDGELVNLMVIVGKIISVDVGTTNISYMVDDTTAEIKCKLWTTTATLSENELVKVFGTINIFQGMRTINAFRIIAVHDPIEIKVHNLEISVAHLHRMKKMRDSAKEGNISGHVQQLDTNMSSNVNGSDLKSKILSIIERNSQSGDIGCDINQVFAALPNDGKNSIRTTMDDMSNAGYLYTTIDDTHYKCTS